ncbi:hypothetical protein ABZS77_00035 [Micromonospora sp. NPDC005298]|uniref:hypothetical protein n=1 Tax=Micromonospora sp. NPDC005298 TaxID=3156873 RepID=UPI0033BA4207
MRERESASAPPRRERPKLTDWLQAAAALAAVLFAVPALVVAVFTYRDQLRVTEAQLRSTEAQLESTRIDRERYDARYAARVTYWEATEDSGRLPAFKVQNRSPVPVMRIQFLMKGDLAGRPIGPFYYGGSVTAPPCSVLTLRLSTFAKGVHHPPPVNLMVAGMQFLDTIGWWHLEAMEAPDFGAVRAPVRLDGRPRQERDEEFSETDGSYPEISEQWREWFRYRAGIPPEGVELRATEVPGTREAAGDCGEGG